MAFESLSLITLKYNECFLTYLDRSGNLSRIKEVTDKYKKKIKKFDKRQTPLIILLELDVVLLTEISGKFIG